MSVTIQEECVSCALCVDVCAEACIVEEEDQFVIDVERCTDCGDCLPACPVTCIVTH